MKFINNLNKKDMKKFVVYYNDGVNEMVDMFQSDSKEECAQWIADDAKGRTLVDDDHNCSESVFYSSKVFRYEVYEIPYIEEIDGEDVFHEPVYTSDYYYAD